MFHIKSSRSTIIILMCSLFIGCMPIAYGLQKNVAVVANSSHFEILHRIEAALFTHPFPRPKLIRIESSNFPNYLRSDRSAQLSLIIAIGAPAMKAVLEQHQSVPVLIILLRQHVVEEILELTHSAFGNPEHPIAAIYLDQPFERQLNLIRCLYPNADFNGPIGVLLGPHSSKYQEVLLRESSVRKFALNIALVDSEESPVPTMNHFLENNKVLLSVPDNIIYNPKTARGILLSAYRKQVPVIGFSRALVQNGALASVYSTDKQIANHVANTIMDITQNQKFPSPSVQYPSDFSVAINYQVARALGLNLPSEDELQSEIENKEKAIQNGVCSINCEKTKG